MNAFLQPLRAAWLAAALCLGLCLSARAEPAQVIDLAELKPRCDAPFQIKKDNSACEINATELVKIGKDNDKARCVGPGLTWDDAKPACEHDTKSFPAPSCGDKLPDLVYNAQAKVCQVVRTTPRSSLGDYVGDCFKVVAVPQPDRLGFPPGTHLEVMSQTPVGNNDKELVVAVANGNTVFGRTLSCGQNTGVARRVNASALVEAGAHRYGWAYGVLTLPFKAYIGDKSISPGGFSLGPYVGRRWGSAGSAVTLAVTSTLGSVKGEVRDAAGNITGTPDLTAFSVAAGVMWDISKNPATKAFKIGVFYGQDRVSPDDAVKYKHNRAPWWAFQIGYDFTDN